MFVLVTVAAGIPVAALAVSWLTGVGSSAHIALGRALYAEHCASCHGAALEGQPNWQERLANGRMPAPPHDASGHTWHHSDDVLFRITKEGVSAVVPGYESDMPAFGEVLSDEEIRAVLAFIKATWPERERNYQEARSRAARSRLGSGLRLKLGRATSRDRVIGETKLSGSILEQRLKGLPGRIVRRPDGRLRLRTAIGKPSGSISSGRLHKRLLGSGGGKPSP